MKTNAEKLIEANEDRNKANSNYREAVRSCIPKGSTIFYKHGDHWRSGCVLLHSGHGRHNSIEIHTPSGKTFWISVEKVDGVRE